MLIYVCLCECSCGSTLIETKSKSTAYNRLLGSLLPEHSNFLLIETHLEKKWNSIAPSLLNLYMIELDNENYLSSSSPHTQYILCFFFRFFFGFLNESVWNINKGGGTREMTIYMFALRFEVLIPRTRKNSKKKRGNRYFAAISDDVRM